MTPSVKRIGTIVASPMSRCLMLRHTTPPQTCFVARAGTITRSRGSLSRSVKSPSASYPLSCFPATTDHVRVYFSTTPQQNQQDQQDPTQVTSSQDEESPSRRMKDDVLKQVGEEQDFVSTLTASPFFLLKDERLPCSQHLDPDGTILPTSEWIHVDGTIPIGSLNQILQAVEKWLREEEEKGIIDLDADWNPVQDKQVPLVCLKDLTNQVNQDNQDNGSSQQSKRSLIEAAHVVLSPFGRPNGWHLKLANRSLVHSILARGHQEGHIKVGWKVVTVKEYHYSKIKNQREDPAFCQNNGLIVDDSIIRIENCPEEMDTDYVRHLLSRYDLAHEGNTVLRWKGVTNDGLVAPLMFIVRFASASWARAAVRELQSTVVGGKTVKLIQYPKQIRYQDDTFE